MALASLVAVVLILGVWSNNGHSFRFELPPNHWKCIMEDMKKHSMSVGNYSIINPNEDHPLPESHKIAVNVRSFSGLEYHISNAVEKGQFSFEAFEQGEYYACFVWQADEKSAPIMIGFDWDIGIVIKELSKIATKSSLTYTEIALRRLHRDVGYISNEITYMRERGEEMQRFNMETNSIMGWFSLLSLGISLSVIRLQVWHLKTFFQKKKVI